MSKHRLTGQKQISSGLFKNCYLQSIHLKIIYIWYVYKQDLALNNLQGLMTHRNQPTNQPNLNAFCVSFSLQCSWEMPEFFFLCCPKIWKYNYCRLSPLALEKQLIPEKPWKFLSENERNKKKLYEYLDLARELKKVVEHEGDSDANCHWNTWNLEKRLGEMEIWKRTKTIQNTALLKSTRILRRIQAIWGDSLSLRLQWKSPV